MSELSISTSLTWKVYHMRKDNKLEDVWTKEGVTGLLNSNTWCLGRGSRPPESYSLLGLPR